MESLASAPDSTGAAAGFFAGIPMKQPHLNYARTAQQIADWQKSGNDYQATGLLGRWGLNEGRGTVANDRSGNKVKEHGERPGCGPVASAPIRIRAPVLTRGLLSSTRHAPPAGRSVEDRHRHD